MTLNRAQRIIVRIGGCVLFFTLLFPPWILRSTGRPFGRAFLFAPPEYEIGGFASYPVMVDTALLFLQAVAIVTGTALLVWWFHSHQAITQSPPEKTSERGIVQRFRRMSTRLRFLLLIALFLGFLVFFKAMYSNP